MAEGPLDRQYRGRSFRPRDLVQQTPQYRIRWASFDNGTGTMQSVGEEIATATSSAAVPADAWGPADTTGLRYAVASIAAIDPAFPHWANPVVVTIRNRAGAVDVVGIERPTGPRTPRARDGNEPALSGIQG